MDSKDLSCVGQVIVVQTQGLLDVKLFKLGHRFIEQYLAVKHFIDQGF